MIWPIIRGESYVGETGKSMKAAGLAVPQRGSWRKISITLSDRIVEATTATATSGIPGAEFLGPTFLCDTEDRQAFKLPNCKLQNYQLSRAANPNPHR
jgi:hypothetical protein